jgi:outer membrane immunogenic protein
MKKILLVGIAAAAFCGAPAFAADRPAPVYKAAPAPAVFNWTGFYAGIDGGYGWSPHSDQLQDFNVGGLFPGLSPKGGFGGGQAGFNWQPSGTPWVLGVETDIQGSGIGKKQTFTPGSAGATGTYTSDLDWFGTVRGRIGYAIDRSLIYFTGGFAYGRVVNDVLYSTGTHYRVSQTATGSVLGGGWEYMLSSAWSVKAEYQYINLGRHDPVTATGISYSSFPGTKVEDSTFHTVRVGLNYKFGSY